MSSDNNGGAAFPAPLHAHQVERGMSMRDYFAAKAMQAAATNTDGANGSTFNQRAEWAYMQADAMLKERSK